MGIKVYGHPMSGATTRVLTCLEEKGLEYELVMVNIMEGAHKQPPHLARNPFGQIPAFQDGDLTLFESGAITKYIAYKYKDSGTDLFRTSDLTEAAMVGVWLEVEAHQFSPPMSALVYEIFMKPKLDQRPNKEIIAKECEKLSKVLDVYEERLSKHKYLAGDYFSLADLHHLSHTHYFLLSDKASIVTSRPHVMAWWEDISSRPAWKKVCEGIKREIEREKEKLNNG